ncbi:hypothetical protein EON63_06715 [archaeon]|nr:MAG: hypothetical protein EON63_06715 [archaeon]
MRLVYLKTAFYALLPDFPYTQYPYPYYYLYSYHTPYTNYLSPIYPLCSSDVDVIVNQIVFEEPLITESKRSHLRRSVNVYVYVWVWVYDAYMIMICWLAQAWGRGEFFVG